MKILIFNTKEIKFVLGEKSNRPLGIEPHRTKDDGLTHFNVAICFVCVESGDTKQDVDVIVQEILKYYEMTNKKILLIPFAHLSSFGETNADKAKKSIEEVRVKIKDYGILAGVSGFGYHKSLIAKWMTFAHPGDVAFRDSKYNKIK